MRQDLLSKMNYSNELKQLKSTFLTVLEKFSGTAKLQYQNKGVFCQ